ncbi:MAG: toll/interleukin-1 receptor domain-containing protein [Steroidobacteraceae bacterium]
MSDRNYAAFISYSHVDRQWARWLHRAIETYRLPPALRSEREAQAPGSSRLAPVFLDREELSSGANLAESVRTALRCSATLIVVCSPGAARSRWVDQEICEFKMLGRGERILCLIVAGEPDALARGFPEALECFPPSLRFEIDDGELTGRPASEPLAADLRAGADERRDAKLKIVAGMLGVPLDALRQRDQLRRQRQLAMIGVVASAGCVVLGGLAVYAWVARNEAVRQRRLAEQKSLTAQRTTGFLVSLFKVSDPSEARGNSITAREILDRGATQIDTALRDEPQVRAELLVALGEVYTGLGLYAPAANLLGQARAIPEQSTAAQLGQAISFAELEFQRGNDQRANELLTQAELQLATAPDFGISGRARLWLDRGEVAAKLERDADAERYLRQALLSSAAAPDAELKARALAGLGMTAFYAGNMDAAQRWYDQALAERIRISGEFHPEASETLNALGSIAYMRGNWRAAERYFLRSLAIDRKVLGPAHTDVAVTMNNIGRLRLERREFAGAVAILNEALVSFQAQRTEVHDESIFALSNLGLAELGLGHSQQAEVLLRQALQAAISDRQRLHGPILSDLADLECRTGRYRAGLMRLEEARPIVAARYPDDPWRSAHVDNVRAGCLAGVRRYAEASALMQSSLPVVLKKWPADTLFGHDALTRAIHLYTRAGDAAKVAQYSAMLPDR